MINVAVLAGGCTPEHTISLLSAGQVLNYMDPTKYRRWPVRLDRDGRWWVTATALTDGAPIPEHYRFAGSQAMRPGAALAHLLDHGRIDVVLPVLHGPNGEDGTVQGMLALHGVPFVGSGCAASAVAMDKIRTRECLLQHGLSMARAYVSPTPLAQADSREEAAAIMASVGFPCFVKVDVSGSSLGVRRVADPTELAAFLAKHRYLGRRFLAEAETLGEEFTVAVLGNTGSTLEALPPVGIYPKQDRYFTYEAKYDGTATDEIVPPPGWSDERVRAVQELALRAHRALVCDGMSRTDMILGEDGPVLLEVNTIPGLTRESLLPKAAAARGYDFPALLDRLLGLALEGRSSTTAPLVDAPAATRAMSG